MSDADFFPVLTISTNGKRMTYDEMKDILQVRLESSNTHAESGIAVDEGTSFVSCDDVNYEKPEFLLDEKYFCPQDPSKIVFNRT